MDLEGFPQYDILYCDPPWEQRMVNWFDKLLEKDTGIVKKHNINDLLIQLAKLSDKNKPLFVEYGLNGFERVERIFKENGHTHNQTITQTQTNGRHFKIISFNTSVKLPCGLKGFDTVKHAVRLTKAKIVFDPFCGLGKTRKAVEKEGASYIGYEINPKRLKKNETNR